MLDATEFCRMTEIRPATLEAWIEAGWLRPRHVQQGWRFSTIDLARAQLILDLRGPMGVNEEGIGVILHLVDQIHGLRRALRATTSTRVVPDVSIAQARAAGSTKSRHMAE